MAFVCVFKRIAKRAMCKAIMRNPPWETLNHSDHAHPPHLEGKPHISLHPRSTDPVLKLSLRRV